MLTQGVLLGQAMAMGGLALGPAMGAAGIGMMRAWFDAGLSVQAAAQRQMLATGGDALEAVEDVIAEVKVGLAPEAVAAGAVIEGRLTGAPAPPAQSLRLGVAHASGNRLRLQLSDPGQRDRLPATEAAIRGFPDVVSVTLRPLTGSLIVEGSVPAADLATGLATSGLIALAGRQPAPLPAFITRLWLARLDALMRVRSDGKQDLRSLLAAMLISSEVLSDGRGRLGPQQLAEEIARRLADWHARMDAVGPGGGRETLGD
ncbi:MAG: hypothetical protein ACFBSD_01375 [Paracoccaceae bacterium]